MQPIEIFLKTWCPYCIMAKELLETKGVSYQVIDLTDDETRKPEMIERSQRHTVPQIFIDHQPIGGFDDLVQLEANGELDQRLGLCQKEPKPPTKNNLIFPIYAA